MSLRLSELAARLGARLENAEGDLLLGCLAMADVAGSDELSFIPAKRVRRAESAGAVLVSAARDYRNALVVDDVMLACARSSVWLPVRRNGAARALRATSLAVSASIAPDVHLGSGVHIGEGTVIERGAVLEDGVSVGAHCRVEFGAVIRGQATLGNRVRIGAGSCIGSDGFAFLRDGAAWCAMPNFGSVRIGDDVTILPQVVVHAGVLGDTVIAQACILDSQVLIGHDSMIGAYSAIAGQTAVAGAARIGRGCRIGGKVGIGEGVEIADGVTITAMSMVTRSIGTAGARYSSGWPAEPSATWWRRVAGFRRTRQ
jgi:UDP-3-O-[3-hydroxymyristoyl] glucosamine N-acyltransferase